MAIQGHWGVRRGRQPDSLQHYAWTDLGEELTGREKFGYSRTLPID